MLEHEHIPCTLPKWKATTFAYGKHTDDIQSTFHEAEQARLLQKILVEITYWHVYQHNHRSILLDGVQFQSQAADRSIGENFKASAFLKNPTDAAEHKAITLLLHYQDQQVAQMLQFNHEGQQCLIGLLTTSPNWVI